MLGYSQLADSMLCHNDEQKLTATIELSHAHLGASHDCCMQALNLSGKNRTSTREVCCIYHICTLESEAAKLVSCSAVP